MRYSNAWNTEIIHLAEFQIPDYCFITVNLSLSATILLQIITH